MTNIDTTFVRAACGGNYEQGALVEPIVLSTTFQRAADGSYPSGYEYARDANPNRAELERAMATLEGGVEAAAFASGMAAALAVFQTLLPRDHVVVSEDSYFGIRETLVNHFAPRGLQVSFIDATDLQAVAACVKSNTRLIFIETPSNPLLRLYDVAAVADIAHSAGALLVCDNTLATPLFQQPFRFGADMVVHSTTKYVNGHHDAQGGIVVAREQSERWRSIRRLQTALGAVPSAFNCWLSSRGLATLPCRLRQQSASAFAIASQLEKLGSVHEVLYPGLVSSRYHALAMRQMTGFGAVFSFRVKGDRNNARSVAAAVRLFQRATSFGGPESLIEHRASIEGPNTNVPDDLLRVAIGLEDKEDLFLDLAQALDSVS